jgi:hypothetical protein
VRFVAFLTGDRIITPPGFEERCGPCTWSKQSLIF